MADENPSIMSHVSLGTNDFPKAREFYVRVLNTLGCRIIMEHEGAAASCGNGVHVGFLAQSKAEVEAFFKEAIALPEPPKTVTPAIVMTMVNLLRLLCA
jgi:catechol 2,3-dioxygenase-like lactoylglutathione lyase family enzyme